MVGDARISAARCIKLLKTWGNDAWTEDAESKEVRNLNLKLALLAEAEGMPDLAVVVARHAVESAKADRHRQEEVHALRGLARALHADAQFDAAVDTYDTLLTLDPDRGNHGNLLDRANRARNLIRLGQFDAGAAQLDAVIERGRGGALSTQATALIYRSELQHALGDSAAERGSLRKALDIYSMHPGTPIDLWGVACV